MRSLAAKLTLAFLLVGLTGAVLVAVFVRYRTQREFDRLVVDQNQQALITNLTRYYQANGSWKGLEAAFRIQQEPAAPIRNPNPRLETLRTLFVVTDAGSTIVFGGRPELVGRQLSRRDLNRGVALEADGETIGWLVFTPAIDRWLPDTPEGLFLQAVNRAALLSAVAAAGIALILGGVLAYTLTRSLRELTAATKELARGRLGTQVAVRSQDELGELAASFNEMSAELERSNQLRRKMTADIAHDLRTPLSVIMGYSEALNDGKLSATPEMFDVLHSETLHLSRLVDDLKTLSLADAGELPLAFQRVNPELLLKRAASAYRVQADAKNIAIQVDITPGLPDVEVDVERMVQVLGNLMSNALRYTPPGGKITLAGGRAGKQVWLSVADNGEGIPPEDLPYVFERSYRGDKARQHPEGESGLGLSIAKSLVEAQRGSIGVTSKEGEGTTFTIHLPSNE
ncbi:MAG: sensor histidine kinase [Anaerolineales bacterium]